MISFLVPSLLFLLLLLLLLLLLPLHSLEIIDLYANMLSGTIPKELAKLPNLRKYTKED